MKSVEVTPVYKKENNPEQDNYRPLSILTVISKLYETVLNAKMVNHFMFNELLAAFRKSYSCQTLLIKFMEDLKSAFDKLHKIRSVYIDLSKSFRLPATRLADSQTSRLHVWSFWSRMWNYAWLFKWS